MELNQVSRFTCFDFYLVAHTLGNYYLERECLVPPEDLQRLIFPQIELTDAASQANGPDRQDIAQRSFMELLRWFRIIILQDAVFLLDKFPASPLWNHHLFRLPQFEEFASRLKIEAGYGEEPRLVNISRVLPDIAHVLREQCRNLHNSLEVHQRSNEIGFKALDTKVQQCVAEIQPFREFVSSLSNDGLIVRLARRDEVTATFDQPSYPVRTRARDVPTVTNPSAVPARGLSKRSDAVPEYQMQRWIQTVAELWEEYDRGIPPAVGEPRGPSIRSLDERHGRQWRRLDTARKAYQCRRFIWEEVIAASKDLGISPDEVAQRIDRWRSAGENKVASLQKLNDMLSAVAENKRPPLWGANHIELLQFA